MGWAWAEEKLPFVSTDRCLLSQAHELRKGHAPSLVERASVWNYFHANKAKPSLAVSASEVPRPAPGPLDSSFLADSQLLQPLPPHHGLAPLSWLQSITNYLSHLSIHAC